MIAKNLMKNYPHLRQTPAFEVIFEEKRCVLDAGY